MFLVSLVSISRNGGTEMTQSVVALAFFVGHVLRCTLPSENPRASRLARNCCPKSVVPTSSLSRSYLFPETAGRSSDRFLRLPVSVVRHKAVFQNQKRRFRHENLYGRKLSSQSSLTRNALFKGIRLSIFFFRCQSPLFLFFTLRTSLQISTNGMTVNASATAMKYSFALMAANSKAVLMPGT